MSSAIFRISSIRNPYLELVLSEIAPMTGSVTESTIRAIPIANEAKIGSKPITLA